LAASIDEAARRTAQHLGIETVEVESTQELADAVDTAVADADVLVMAAAVADFRPARAAEGKIKKDGSAPAPIELVENPDILAGVAQRRRSGLLVVGFAAETGSAAEVLELGRAKARRKGADLLAVNAVGGGQGFGDVPNAVTVLDRHGEPVGEVAGTKDEVAAGLWDLIESRLGPADSR
ncbi:MAG TPA: phosphopantothenoylcysteine decarboxylase, partial [Actinomycetaceae bacterium]|nr:phosphopantothenoylcysteine decarboxylase [Actinomycetaceae bacterium]